MPMLSDTWIKRNMSSVNFWTWSLFLMAIDTIVVKNVILTKGLQTEKLYGLGIDGAAVMTGNYFMPM